MLMLRLYTTSPATLQLAALGLTGQLGQRVLVLPLSALPAPLPVRLSSLRLERTALQQDARVIAWLLSQYAAHYLLPDACHEHGLRADLDATRARLRAVEATLHALAGEEPAA